MDSERTGKALLRYHQLDIATGDQIGRLLKVVWAAALLRQAHDAILVRKRGKGFDAGKWGPPGGKVERGETVAECLVRGLKEETGIRAERWVLRQIYDTPTGICFLYEITHWAEPRYLLQERDHGPWYWLSPDQLQDELLQDGLARWLGNKHDTHARCIPLLPETHSE